MTDQPRLDELLDQVLAGGPVSRQAWDPLYRRCYAFVRAKGVPPKDAQDVVSIVIAKLVRRSIPDTVDNRQAYLYKMLENDAMTWHRGRSGEGDPERDDDDDDDDSKARVDDTKARDYNTNARQECLRKALAALALDSEERATVLRLAYLEGWKGQEIAEHIGRSHGATREFLSQTRKKFRKLLLQMCGKYLTVGVLEP